MIECVEPATCDNTNGILVERAANDIVCLWGSTSCPSGYTTPSVLTVIDTQTICSQNCNNGIQFDKSGTITCLLGTFSDCSTVTGYLFKGVTDIAHNTVANFICMSSCDPGTDGQLYRRDNSFSNDRVCFIGKPGSIYIYIYRYIYIYIATCESPYTLDNVHLLGDTVIECVEPATCDNTNGILVERAAADVVCLWGSTSCPSGYTTPSVLLVTDTQSVCSQNCDNGIKFDKAGTVICLLQTHTDCSTVTGYTIDGTNDIPSTELICMNVCDYATHILVEDNHNHDICYRSQTSIILTMYITSLYYL